ncbi:alpha/beta fold hydrolase [Variovorax sp. J22R133]|nr:alpha/beta fold hydrolase [Variovorax sp. J22R133]MDM0116572.1 alpha/beta fold hydrolase [Variovorax sp. J22R133]
MREPHTWPTFEALARKHTLLRYDARGCGLSTRKVPHFDFETLLGDFETVMDAMAPEPVALLGVSCGAPIAIAYAARHPERVSAMVLVNGYARAYLSSPSTPPHLLEEAKLLLATARQGWGQERSPFQQVFIAQFMGAAAADPATRRLVSERMRLSMTPEIAERHLRVNFSIDVKAECALVQCPTLVFHARDDQMVTVDQGRKVAAWIPGARFVLLETDCHLIPSGHSAGRVFVTETLEFLGGQRPDKPALSRRQTEILRFVARGMTDKQIARELGLSPRTVEMHVALALRALGCANRAEAVHRANLEGLLVDSYVS